MRLHRLLDRIRGQAEEINGAERCPTYLFRWTLLKSRFGNLYLHKFVGDDWALDLHDHPKRFVSLGLWGSYLEENRNGFRRYRAPWIRSFPAAHAHRLTTPWGNCWTLVFVGRAVRPWGFWHRGVFIPWRKYVNGAIGDKMKSCE